jgi:hypothetical protein
MKFAFLAGGFTGFALAALAGLSAGREADLVLRDAAVACLVGAFLFRWFWSVLINAFVVTARAKRAAALAEEEARAAAQPATPAPVSVSANGAHAAAVSGRSH